MDPEGGASVGGVHQSQVRREGQLLLGGMSGDGREPALAKAGVAWLELEGNSNAATSVAFLKQLKEKHPGPLKVIWDNAPAHRGEALREYLRTPGLELQLVNPRFHEGRFCRATVRTSTVMKPSGDGPGRACPRENGGSHGQPVSGAQSGGAR